MTLIEGSGTRSSTPGSDRSAEHLWLHYSRLADDNSDDLVVDRARRGRLRLGHPGQALPGWSGRSVRRAGRPRPQGDRRVPSAAQAEKLGFFPLWTYAHPTAIELADRLAAMAPGDLNRVFLTTGGGEAVESAWKLARQYFLEVGQPERVKVIARRTAYHGSNIGALNITGLEAIKEPFLPLLNGLGSHAATTNKLHCEFCSAQRPCSARLCATTSSGAILEAGPETVAAVFLEPVQNSGGCFVPAEGYFAEVREICDRYGVLLVSDEVICAFGRLGDWFGGEPPRLPARHVDLRQGRDLGVLAARRAARQRPSGRALPRGHELVPARHHLRWPPRQLRGSAREPRRDGTRGPARPGPRARGRVPVGARDAARPADRRRGARHGLLLRHRADQRRRRLHRRPSASGSSVASCRPGCWSWGWCVGPTTGATR